MSDITALRARHADELRLAREREQLADEIQEVRGQTYGLVMNQYDAGGLTSDQRYQLAAAFGAGSDEQLAGWRAAAYPTDPGGDTGALFRNPDGSRNYYQRDASSKPKAILVAPGDSIPDGWEPVDLDLAQIRRDAERQRALANARRARVREGGIVGDDVDVQGGYSESGVGYRTERGGERVAELRPVPMSAEQNLESILGEVPGLLTGFPAGVVEEAIRIIRENVEHPDLLSLVAATQQLIPGPEPNTTYPWRRLVNFDPSPDGGFPRGQNVRTYTLRRILDEARKRRDQRLVAGQFAAEFERDLW